MDSELLSIIIVFAVAFIALRMIPRMVAGVPFVEAKDVHSQMETDDNAVLLDVRTPEEFAAGHATNSINVQPFELGDDIEAKRAFMTHKVFVICLTSQRAAMAAKQLKRLGFTNVSVVKGGFKAWQKLELPTG